LVVNLNTLNPGDTLVGVGYTNRPGGQVSAYIRRNAPGHAWQFALNVITDATGQCWAMSPVYTPGRYQIKLMLEGVDSNIVNIVVTGFHIDVQPDNGPAGTLLTIQVYAERPNDMVIVRRSNNGFASYSTCTSGNMDASGYWTGTYTISTLPNTWEFRAWNTALSIYSDSDWLLVT